MNRSTTWPTPPVPDRYDPLVVAARILYEAGRLDGDGFLDALGSYIFRPLEHIDQPAEDQS